MEAGLYPRAEEALAALEKAAPGAPAALARSALWEEVHGAMERAVEKADAAAQASAAAGEDPEARAWYEARAGDLRFHRGDLDGAKARFEAALAIHESHPAALHGLVAVRRAKGDGAGAREILERLAAALPTPKTLFDLSEVLAALGKAEEAEKAQDRAVALATREGAWRRTYRREMAEFLVDRGGDPERALQLAKEDLEDRGDVHGHAVVAWCLHRCGKDEEAAAEMDRAMALGTHEPEFWERAGLIHLARGEKEKAKVLLERVRAIAPFLMGDEAKKALAESGK
jgi:tetratricopeptide (TPR) repeat protein